MDAIDVVVGRAPIRYHPAGAAADPSAVAKFNERDDALARDHPRMRRIFVRVFPDSRWPIQAALHWSDGSDLRLFDEVIRSGPPTAGHLENALAGEFDFHYCAQCAARFRVLVYTTYFTSLFGIPLLNARRHIFHEHCPNCEAPTRRPVLEFLERLG